MLYHRFRAVQYDRLRYTREKLKWYQRLRRKKENEWRIMTRATAVGSHPFLGKISTFHCHCRLSCKDTCTCTCCTHIHSFWTNRIIVRWCSSQTHSVSFARASYIGRMKKISARHHRVIIVWSSPFLSRCLQKWRCKKLVKCKILSPAYNIEEFSSSHFRPLKLSRCFGIEKKPRAQSQS